MKRKLDIVRGLEKNPPTIHLSQEDQIKAIDSVKEGIDNLYNLLNDKEEYDFGKLEKQLEVLHEALDFTPLIQKLDAINKKEIGEVGIKDFSQLLEAVQKNKPVPVNLDKLEKAIIQVEQRIQENTVDPSQAPSDYQPVRRVVKAGNILVFDDQPTPSRGGGGGSSSSGGSSTAGLTDAELRATPVPVSGTFYQATQPVSATALPQLTQPTALIAFSTDIPTAGNRVQLGTNTVLVGVVIQAKSTNTGSIFVGGSNVSSTVFGAELQPGQSVGLAIDNTNKVYVDTATNGNDVAVFGS